MAGHPTATSTRAGPPTAYAPPLHNDITDVTKTNFWAVLPAIRAALSSCAFFSLDLEMTGLFLDHHRDEYLDEPSDRYSRVREAAAAYSITQVGLSCWRALPPGEGGGFEATTFNAWVFPTEDRRFLADSGAMAFLASQGFDFNTWVREGVPYMPLQLHQERMAAFEKQADERAKKDGPPRAPVSIERPDDVAFVQRTVAAVAAWVATDSPELVLPRMSSFQRLLAYQELARPRLWAAGGEVCATGEAAPDPGFYTTKADVAGWTHIRVVRGDRLAAEAAEAAQLAARREVLARSAGFAEVLRAMRDCGRPAVCHNGFFDVAYVLASFGHGVPLPSGWPEFRGLVAEWFPGGLFDTKLLAQGLPAAVLPLGTGLQEVFTALTADGEPRAAALALLGRVGAAPPPIRHAHTTQKYAGGGTAHEAGYDAFMTGAAFASLLALVPAARALQVEAQQQQQQQQQQLETAGSSAPEHIIQPAVASFNGRIHVGRSDLPYIALFGPEPLISRPAVVHIAPPATLPAPLRIPDLFSLLEAAGLPNRPRVTPLPAGGGFFLELAPDLVDEWPPPRLAAGLAQAAAAKQGRQQQREGEGGGDAPGTALGWRAQSWEAFSATKAAAAAESAAAGAGNGTTPNSAKRPRVEAVAQPPAAPPPSMLQALCTPIPGPAPPAPPAHTPRG